MKPALDLLRLLEDLERQGTSVIDLVTGGQPVQLGRVCRERGVVDRSTRHGFYYHRHGSDAEAGHFHTVRVVGDHTVHLAGISMAADGWPQSLFTVNLWVTGDAYASAADLRRYVRGFHVREQVGPVLLVRFVNLVFEVFGPHIERLQNEKIATLARYRMVHADRDIFEDRSLEILSRVEIDIQARAVESTH